SDAPHRSRYARAGPPSCSLRSQRGAWYHRGMRWLGRTDLRVLFAILITALIPLVGSVAFARKIVAHISATAFQPEFGAHLDQALTVYADLAKAMKDGLKHEA